MMFTKFGFRVLSFAAALMLAAGSAAIADDHKEEGFEAIFDGKTLKDWKGDPKFWSVEDGAITGTTTPENPTKGNTFIYYTGGQPGDFELRMQYRIGEKGNSGIQYRSFKLPGKNDGYRIGGYQADIDSGPTYSGINYGERFRGILAKRGQKTEIQENGKPKVLKQFADGAKLNDVIKKNDWNDYRIVAKGFTFQHYINGTLMSEVHDMDKDTRRADGLLAFQLHQGPPMKVQFRNIRIKHFGQTDANAASPSADQKKVVFVAGRKSHGYGSHEHKAGCMLLAQLLEENHPGITTEVVTEGWPEDESVFEGADAIVIFADGGGRHPIMRNLKSFNKLIDAGVGVGCLHYAVEVPKGSAGKAMLRATGGYFETNWSVNPHWDIENIQLGDHPIANGVKQFTIRDEWYYHMRFPDDMKGVTPILSALPPKESLKRGDGPHSNNPHVREAVLKRMEPQHVMWAIERPDGSRGFGFTGGHFHWNWGHDQHRKLALNGIAWIAKAQVPKDGVPSKTPTVDELMANQDYNPPGNFNKEAMQQKINAFNGKQSARSAPSASQSSAAQADEKKNVKPIFKSKVITPSTPGHMTEIKVEIKGAQALYLVVTDGGNGYSCDWADWAQPRLVGPDGEKKLTELKWKSASAAFGDVQVNRNVRGAPLKIAGKSIPYGIGTHANSVIAYDLPKGHTFTHFIAQGGLDEGGTSQGSCGQQSSVAFLVYTQAPPASAIASTSNANPDQYVKRTNAPGRDPASALAALDVHEDLQAQLFAAEPMMLSPSNAVVDHKGRVWVCEIVNYRRHKGKRPEGDRIIILEDTNGDGHADKTKVFYQGKDIDSPHGVCVLPTPSGKGTKVIVSAGDKVQVFTDADGDDKADSQKVLFSGISGAQHDHGIHAFVFGPDGKLYFNFGNTGRQIKDAAGKPIIDKAGNEVKIGRNPYQEGMVFRCNLDGSEFETLGWNFRNNWEVTVDSFGALWQSDNDDDGNRGVRINFVMEFGNYGYKDEITGAGWKSKRPNLEAEIPLRHWHLNDPGVVPNLLQTGAGSPTGITVYEGDLLPKVFQGQVIHTDAGPNVCRAYPVKKDGAGYSAETVNILLGLRDRWFRPSDVDVAPDGSLIIADWYDPGVGGHGMGDLDRGRLFRIVPKGHDRSYKIAKFDYSTAVGAAEAMKNPNYTVRSIAWTVLHGMGDKAEPALLKLWQSDNPVYRARALWLLGKIAGKGQQYVAAAIADADPDIRITGIRLARQLPEVDKVGVITQLLKDPSPQVRRELCVAIRDMTNSKISPEHLDWVARSWATLAMQHDGKDRWYLEALGIAAHHHWDACFARWQAMAGEKWNTPAGRDIVWRARAQAALPKLVKLATDPAAKDKDRYIRAFDFHPKSNAKDAALEEILLSGE